MIESVEFQYQTTIHRLEKLKLFYVEIPLKALEFFSTPETKNIFNQRLMIALNGGTPGHGGVVSLGNQTGYISIKGKILKDLHLSLGDTVNIMLTEDTTEFGMEFPEELQEILRQDPEAERRFNALPMGKRRYIIYTVLQVKNSQLRIDRAWKMMTNLKNAPEGKESFKDILGK